MDQFAHRRLNVLIEMLKIERDGWIGYDGPGSIKDWLDQAAYSVTYAANMVYNAEKTNKSDHQYEFDDGDRFN